MKRVILASALIAISALSASAQQASVALPAAIHAQVLTMVPTTDLSNLTTAQYARLVTLFSDSKNLRAGENPVGAVKVILNAQ